ncbi:MAG: PASTA domain-containing protein [Rikenellaceae bacterium]
MKKKRGILSRIAINVAIMVAVILGIAVASHYLLRMGTRHNAHCTVPEFKGISLREAEILAEANELKIIINDSLYVPSYAGGTVLDQLPAAGVEVKPGRTIYVVINAYGNRMVKIPYVAGRSLRQAKNMLDVAGLEIQRINYVNDMATNYVLEQSYRGRTIEPTSTREAPVGAGVELEVGVSPDNPTTRIPNVIGLSLKEAKSRIWESGLNVGRIDIDQGVNLLRDKNAKVYIQGLVANTTSKWGTSINISLTLNTEKIDAAIKEAHLAELEYEKQRIKGKQQETTTGEDATEEAYEEIFFE